MAGITDDAARLEWLLTRLEGLPCFSTIVGDDVDYALVLDLGERRRRSLRLANPRLSFLQRTYEGAAGLLLECPWRIDGPDRVIASCFEPRGAKERGASAVADLVDRTVESARARAPGYDLELKLSGGWTLRAFALERSERPRRDNWSVWTPDGSVVVGPRSVLETEPPEGGPGGDVARWRMRLTRQHGSNDT